MIQHGRDEAHRFAVSYHRKLRGKRMVRSALDGIPGLGEVRKKKLLKHFGSVKRIRAGAPEDLRAVPGVPPSVADAVYAALHPGERRVTEEPAGERDAVAPIAAGGDARHA